MTHKNQHNSILFSKKYLEFYPTVFFSMVLGFEKKTKQPDQLSMCVAWSQVAKIITKSKLNDFPCHTFVEFQPSSHWSACDGKSRDGKEAAGSRSSWPGFSTGSMEVSSLENGGSPLSLLLLYFMENPIIKWITLGVPNEFWETPISIYIHQTSNVKDHDCRFALGWACCHGF